MESVRYVANYDMFADSHSKVTEFGHLLRKSCFDELLYSLNVFRE